MKKIVAVISLILVLAMGSCFAFAASLEVTGINPVDGKKGLQVNNLAVKVHFSEDVSAEANDAVNENKVYIVDGEGKKVDLQCQLAHSKKQPNELWYVFTGNLESNTQYTIKIDSGIKSSAGNTLSNPKSSTFSTRNTKTDSVISIAMMVGMFAVMFIATTKATKKSMSGQQAEMAAEKARVEALNPYKIAKEKNISLDEAKAYVAKEKEKYKREEEKLEAERRKKEAERQAKVDALEEQIEIELAQQRQNYNYHVKAKASFVEKTGREVPKAVIKQKKRSQEIKLAKKKAEEELRIANMKGRKSKK